MTKDCDFLNWYFNYGPPPPPIITPSNTVTCINPAYSLINYSVTLSPPNFGIISIFQTVITDSFDSSRVWTFTLGGVIYDPIFYVLYNFPNCYVPNGKDLLLLDQINFQSPQDQSIPETLQGYIIVNNVNIPISGNKLLAHFTWDRKTTTFTLFINLFAASNYHELNFIPNQKNSFFLNLTIRDGSSNSVL